MSGPHKRLLGYDYMTTHLVGSISGENVGMILWVLITFWMISFLAPGGPTWNWP